MPLPKANDITPDCAYAQIKRVAKARGMKEADVKAIVDNMVEQPLLGIFGPAKINVLKLNVAMEEANPTIDQLNRIIKSNRLCSRI